MDFDQNLCICIDNYKTCFGVPTVYILPLIYNRVTASLLTYDFSTLYTTLPHNLIKD